MTAQLSISGKPIADDAPVFITAEIGINHNGNLDLAKELIDVAVAARCDAVKFQKRTPEKCVPRSQWNVRRETPWGTLTYMEYRYRLEFDAAAYREIDRYCKQREIIWFASCWDEQAADFLTEFSVPCFKVPSACLTNDSLLRYVRLLGRPVILSTGMSTLAEVRHAVSVLGADKLILLQCTAAYPTEPEELNLRVIPSYRKLFGCPVGYSGHETTLSTTVAAVALGARYVERHITKSRDLWGSDQAASLEPEDLGRLVRDIRIVEQALGDGNKRVYDSELDAMRRLRGNSTADTRWKKRSV